MGTSKLPCMRLKFLIFSFKSYVYYLTSSFISSARTFNILTRAFNLPTSVLIIATCAYSLLTRGLLTRKSCFTFPKLNYIKDYM